MATLHFIFGKVASGKTTLARQLAANHSAVLFVEDELLVPHEPEIKCFDDFVRLTGRLRGKFGPRAVKLLRRGTSVVLDIASGTVADRAWVRSIFEAAGADHVLHVIDAPDDVCRQRLRQRNETKPEGLYYLHVSEDTFEEATRRLVPPSAAERFQIRRYDVALSAR